ncbi:uncharacterized protein LOC122502000 [Leptopilina heterotoma]|uniref:uncharacterized protein LOC122502000 n=1 Tax=Leptopilina heterotoma TaxID=63436 RepID=UPI001CA9C261|nr:uncharacterized protein LOC122502000 [Leptopilina heterotoma]
MFSVKIVLLCSAIFVFADGKSYGKNWYPKKYTHSIHKRVDPDYWEDLPLEDNSLSGHSSSGTKILNFHKNEFIENSPRLYRKYSPYDKHSLSQKILKRNKRDINVKIKNQKTKKYNKHQDREKNKTNSKYEKMKKFIN